ncbi:hypothetical protein LINPERHAP2_LOCUS18593 [Linum perenne]
MSSSGAPSSVPSPGSSTPTAPSFKDAVAGNPWAGVSPPSEFKVDDSYRSRFSKELVDGNKFKPMISLDPELKKELCEVWKNAIIIKVYGKSVGYFYLLNRLQTLWKLEAEMEFLDVGCGYFVAKFSSRGDWLNVISGGPYRIAGCFLALRQWSPDFVPSTERVSSIVAWIRFSELPLEYYSEGPLFQLAACVGKPLRIDTQTTLATRGKFARVCVELNLDEPLMPVVGIEGRWYKVEYEGISNICITCGCAGHNSENCLSDVVKSLENGESQPSATIEVTENDSPPSAPFGDWMIVQNKSQKRRGPRKTGNSRKAAVVSDSGTNRFQALEAINVQPEETKSSPEVLPEAVVEVVMEEVSQAIDLGMPDNSCPNPLFQAELSVVTSPSPKTNDVSTESTDCSDKSGKKPELPSIQKALPGVILPSKSDSEMKRKSFEDLTNRQRNQNQSLGKITKGDRPTTLKEGRDVKSTSNRGRAASRSRTPPRRNL